MLKKIIFWPFRNIYTIGFSFAVLIGGTYWGYTLNQERNFNRPIVLQSIKLMAQQQKVKQLIGIPLSYTFQVSNRWSKKDTTEYFNFQVSGPKARVIVEMTTQALKVKQIYEYDKPIQNIQKIKREIQVVQKKLNQLTALIPKHKDKKKQELIIQKQVESKQLEKLNNLLIEERYNIIEKKLKYFVPQRQTYSAILNKQAANSDQILDKEENLWGVKDLVATLPNRTKLIIYPRAKKTFEQKRQIVNSTSLPSTPTYSYFHKLTEIDISDLTKEEIEEYSNQKIRFMYTKYNGFRLMSGTILLGLVFAFIKYKDKSLIRSIKGSVLENEAKLKIRAHPKVVQLLALRNKEIAFDSLIGGGISDKIFDCSIGLYGLTNGKVYFSGKYDASLNFYKFEKLMLSYRQKQKKIEIDLLK